MTEVLADVEYNLQNECYKKKKKSGIIFANFLIKNVSHTSCECASQFYWLTGFNGKETRYLKSWKVHRLLYFGPKPTDLTQQWILEPKYLITGPGNGNSHFTIWFFM